MINELEINNPSLPTNFIYLNDKRNDWYINWRKIYNYYKLKYSKIDEDTIEDVVEEKINNWNKYMKYENDEDRLILYYSTNVKELNKSLYDFIDPFIKHNLNNINEVQVQSKPIIGAGIEHDIYPDIKNPSRIYKVPKDAIAKQKMYEWIKIFNKYPQVFAKIYKAKDNSYVSLEKLNTSRVKQEYDKLFDYFTTKHILIDDSDIYGESGVNDPLTHLFLTLSIFYSESKTKEMLSKMKKLDPSIIPIFNNWLKLSLNVKNVAEKESKSIDFHMGNFGYDSQGNLKMLDI